MRSSASEWASPSAPGGSSPSRRSRIRRRLLQQPDERPEQDEERAYRRRDGERGPLRVPERDPFRHELADHDVQVGDDQEGQDDGEERRHHAVETVGEHLLAERADGEARDRHAELHRRDEPRRVAGDPTHRSRALVPLVLELQDARPARGDEAVFGRDEERVHQDEAGERQHLEGERHRERPEDARVLGGRSSSTRISRSEYSRAR